MVKLLFYDIFLQSNMMFRLRKLFKSILIIAVFSFACIKYGYAQNHNFFIQAEDSLVQLSAAIVQPLGDQQRLDNNQSFKDFFKEVLLFDDNLSWGFDSLHAVNILKAPDESFRIITWYVPFAEGGFSYFGFVQTPTTANENSRLYLLTDQTSLIQNPGTSALSHKNWYGAWYYELIHNQYQENNYYTLLGWKGNNSLTSKRVIESFSLTSDGPVFGSPVFQAGSSPRHRIIFEYSARVAMSLRYEQQRPQAGQPLRWMIIFDRLAPTHESLAGHFRHYVPEVNIFDAFIFEEGRWVFVRDVDARAPQR